MNEKKKIYYTRTYRHLKKNHLKSVLYLLIFILPCLIIFSMNLHNLTKFISDTGVAVLGRAFPGIPMYISRDVFSFLGTIEYIDMPTTCLLYTSAVLSFGCVPKFKNRRGRLRACDCKGDCRASSRPDHRS